jgi:hypothetical protein
MESSKVGARAASFPARNRGERGPQQGAKLLLSQG